MTGTPPEESNQQAKNTCAIINKAIHCLALFAVSITSAWVAGRMIGISQHDNIVIAAVLPVILSAGWVLFSFRFADLDNKNTDYNLIIAAITLLLFFYILVHSSNSIKHDVMIDLKNHLEACSRIEFDINQARSSFKLPPLDSEYFCNK